MSLKIEIENSLITKTNQFLTDINLPYGGTTSDTFGVNINYVITGKRNKTDVGLDLIVQATTIKTKSIISVVEFKLPLAKYTKALSVSEIKSVQLSNLNLAFDSIKNDFGLKIKEWVLNNKNTNLDFKDNDVQYFYNSTITNNIDDLPFSGSSGSSGTSGSSGSSGTSGTSGSSNKPDIPVNTDEEEFDTSDDYINNKNITDDVKDKNVIKSTDNNNIVKDSVKSDDDVNIKNSDKEKNKPATLGKGIGGLGGSQPVIMINDYVFSSREIVSMEISSTSFLPTISLVISLQTGIFISRHFPKDGDVVNVFIRSYNDVFKPIRNDYLITHVDTTASKDKEGSEITLFIDGILNINYLFAENCKAIKNKTSYEALLEISKDLKLGFASNETNTDDKMTWICPYDTYKNWIDNITIHAYKDNKSFFDSWVDLYYCFNFINMNTVYSVSDEAEAKDGIMSSVQQVDHNRDDNITSQKTVHHFSNAPAMDKTNYYYNSFEFINNSGEINILNGYKRYVHFYDVSKRDIYSGKKEKHDVIFVDPYSTDKVEEYKSMMKGRANEKYYQNTNKRKWQGVQYSNVEKHNVHAYWKYAEFINFQNLEFVDKMLLKITLPKPNYNVYRGQRLPLTCIITKDVERGKVAGSVGKDDYKALGLTVDRFLSANNYVVVGMKIIYSQVDDDKSHDVTGKIEQELYLSRREWEMPTSEGSNGENYQSNSL